MIFWRFLYVSCCTKATKAMDNHSAIVDDNRSGPKLTMRCGRKQRAIFCTKTERKKSPVITIEAFTIAQGQNFGEVFFSILDKKPYKGTFNCKHQIIKEGVISEFSKVPQFNCIIRGRGCTVMQQFQWIIWRHKLDISLDEFTQNMALYMYSRYVLSFFLYGHASPESLSLRTYPDFLYDLKHSRFREFSVIFNNKEEGTLGIEKYFRNECESCD